MDESHSPLLIIIKVGWSSFPYFIRSSHGSFVRWFIRTRFTRVRLFLKCLEEIKFDVNGNLNKNYLIKEPWTIHSLSYPLIYYIHRKDFKVTLESNRRRKYSYFPTKFLRRQSPSEANIMLRLLEGRVAPDTELAGYPANLFCWISGIRPDIRLNS